jgi:hypothetical protein
MTVVNSLLNNSELFKVLLDTVKNKNNNNSNVDKAFSNANNTAALELQDNAHQKSPASDINYDDIDANSDVSNVNHYQSAKIMSIKAPSSSQNTPGELNPLLCQSLTGKGTQCTRGQQPGRQYCGKHGLNDTIKLQTTEDNVISHTIPQDKSTVLQPTCSSINKSNGCQCTSPGKYKISETEWKCGRHYNATTSPNNIVQPSQNQGQSQNQSQGTINATETSSISTTLSPISNPALSEGRVMCSARNKGNGNPCSSAGKYQVGNEMRCGKHKNT